MKKTIIYIINQKTKIMDALAMENEYITEQMKSLFMRTDKESIVRYAKLADRKWTIELRMRIVNDAALRYIFNTSLAKGYGCNVQKAQDDLVSATRMERLTGVNDNER